MKLIMYPESFHNLKIIVLWLKLAVE